MKHDEAWAKDMLGSTVDWWGERATVVGVLRETSITLQFREDGRQVTVGVSTTTPVRGRHRAEPREQSR